MAKILPILTPPSIVDCVDMAAASVEDNEARQSQFQHSFSTDPALTVRDNQQTLPASERQQQKLTRKRMQSFRVEKKDFL